MTNESSSELQPQAEQTTPEKGAEILFNRGIQGGLLVSSEVETKNGPEALTTIAVPTPDQVAAIIQGAPEGKVQAAFEPYSIPTYVPQRERVLFLTGLHAETGIPLLIKLAALNLRKYRLDPEVHKMHWKNGDPFELKRELLWEDIRKSRDRFHSAKTSLVGISAGAVPSLIGLKELPEVNKVITLCGWCQPEKPENVDYLRPLVVSSAAFDQAVEYLGKIGVQYSPEELNRILNFWTRVDEYIPVGTGSIKGVRQVELPYRGHVYATARSLLRTRTMAEHINKP